MLRTVALWFIIICFGLVTLTMVFAVASSLLVSVVALGYRMIPGPNVPFTYNLRNVMVRWKNALVTVLALTMVVGIVVFMLAFVTGMYRLTESSGRPGNVILLQDGSTDEAFSNLPASADVLRLDEKVRKQILEVKINNERRYLASKEVFLIVNQPIPNAPSSGRQRRFVQIRGVDNALIAARVHGIQLQPGGRWFTQEGVQTLKHSAAAGKKYDDLALLAAAGGSALAGIQEDRAIEVVIGAGIARELGSDKPGGIVETGDVLDIGGRKWIVVGIMATGSSTFASEVWTRDYLVQEQFGRRNSYSTYVIATRDAKSAAKMAKDMKEFKELAVSAQPETEYYAKLSATNQQFLYSILFVAIVMSIAGVLGVMITMFAAISQRSKDIGVMRLLGYTRWQILVSFLLESLAIALVGGVMGCCLGFLADGLTATSIVSSGMGGGKSVILKLVVDAKTLGVGLLFALIMGSVGGLVPALSAMRLRPLESLR